MDLSAFRDAGVELPCGSSAPSRCALDGAHRASAPPLTARSLISEEGRTPLRAVFPLPRCFRPRTRLATNASDAPCRAPRVPGNPGLFSRNQDRFHRHRVQRRRFSRPKAPSIDKCSLRSFACAKPLGLVGARHRCPRFCHRDPASDAFSLPQMLSHGEARPFDVSAGSSPAGAMGRAPPVDFCNRIDPRARTRARIARTPRTVQVVAHLRSSSRGWLR